jgi:hypothetical protein
MSYHRHLRRNSSEYQQELRDILNTKNISKATKSSPDLLFHIKKSKIPGGLAEGKKPSDFPKFKLSQGKKVEMEHTSEPEIAEEIAMDHLTEDPKYYEKLKTIETKKAEPLMKPYSSEAQRKWAHTKSGMKALGGKEAVKEWDKQSKGKDLPEKIEKMSRPRITFPNLKQVSTRPDQDVQLIETGRQKDLYGKKVANAEYGGKPLEGKTRLKGSSRVLNNTSELIDAYGKRVAGKFDRNTLGLNHQTPRGPKPAALAGKMRSKYEEGDDEYAQKVQAYEEKKSQVIRDYGQAYQDWQSKAYELSKLDFSKPENRKAYEDHIASKPKKPKLPRTPSKKAKDTKQLTPEQATLRGRTVDSTIEHEGFHSLIDQISDRYGPNAAVRVKQKLLEQHHPDAIKAVGNFIADTRRYKRDSPFFGEEILAHARDLLVNPKKREDFKRYIKDDNLFNQHMKNLKRGHQKAYKVAQSIKPEDITTSMENQQMAASEEMKKGAARRIFGKLDPNKLPGRDKVNEWQQSVGFLQDMDSSYDDETHRQVRSEIPKMEGGLRLRALNKLSNKTLTRIHPETGKRQFLLFRGISGDEKENVLNRGLVRHNEHSSWTPHIAAARGFEEDYDIKDDGSSKTIAAWIDEDKIHSAPHMYGKMPSIEMDMDNAGKFYTPDKNKPGKNDYSFEHEIIVAPHTSDRATKGDVKRYYAIHTPTRTKMAQTDPQKDLHGRINYRGERDKSGFRSTKQYPLVRETKPLPSAVKDIMRAMKAPKKMAASEEENE